ncbi:hypothetical protein [Bradyrhizobium nitroreducens]|uniref:hypothetical protein n=1 Tax=Bradyrhizobium nitroreducens TaxID=709803 RepID=UPI0013750E5B|nr:hypothetical protein [Bradyrhizobium nitroreducens]
MNGHRLSGRYCALQTLNQSERAANDLRQTAGNTAARDDSPTNGGSLYDFAALYWFTGD